MTPKNPPELTKNEKRRRPLEKMMYFCWAVVIVLLLTYIKIVGERRTREFYEGKSWWRIG